MPTTQATREDHAFRSKAKFVLYYESKQPSDLCSTGRKEYRFECCDTANIVSTVWRSCYRCRFPSSTSSHTELMRGLLSRLPTSTHETYALLLLLRTESIRIPAEAIDHASVRENHTFIPVSATGQLRGPFTRSATGTKHGSEENHEKVHTLEKLRTVVHHNTFGAPLFLLRAVLPQVLPSKPWLHGRKSKV